jgi:hypothetical protein
LQASSQPFRPQTGEPFAPGGQTVPQLLQFIVSESSATQSPSHEENPLLQANSHVVTPHFAAPLFGTAHEVPQSLQCFGSLARSAQVPPQLVCPLGQSLEQVPS